MVKIEVIVMKIKKSERAEIACTALPTSPYSGMKLAVFGGTFNPIHKGHLLVAENACKTALLDRVLFMPCARPPHKDRFDLVSDEHRLHMIREAVAGRKGFEASDLEVKRGGISYTVDTLREVRRFHPTATLFFIVGSDNFQTLNDWRDFSEILELCVFLVVERPGCPIDHAFSALSTAWGSRLRYFVCPGSTVEISSSEIRRLLREGKNVSQFLSSAVYDYIRVHRLYS